MTTAEQQAYEVLLQEAEKQRQHWEYLARAAMVSLDCVETMLMISKQDFAMQEIDSAKRHFERMTGEKAA